MADEAEKKKLKRSQSPCKLEDDYVEPPSFSLAALGLQRVGAEPPPKPQQQPLQILNSRGIPARIRKLNRFFFDDDIINDDKPLRMSLSPRKTPVKTKSPLKSASKVLKKRKGVSSRYMRSNEKKEMAATSPSSKSSQTRSAPSTPKSSTKAVATSTPTKPTSSTTETGTADKKIGQSIGMRLRNLLKLPKAHKWVIFEWFYSFMDHPLFEGENDFQLCFNEAFPRLHTCQLTRFEWQMVRSKLGKPRRCSPAFFNEQRQALERKRQKMRFLHTRKAGDLRDLNAVRELPEKIPLPLPVGTKVTARLRIPQDGIFSGTVDAFDSLNSSYRITFDRTGLGTHSIPDYEIVSENFHEMLPLQSMARDFRPNWSNIFNGPSTSQKNMRGIRSALSMNLNKSDPLLGQEVIDSPFKNPVLGRENINGYPAKLLETIVRLKRALAIKRSKLQRLSDMNDEAEIKTSKQISTVHNNSSSSDEFQSEGECVPFLGEEFQRRYASIVISMEKMNRDMQEYLNMVQAFATDLSRDPQVQAMLAPSYLREKCREAAEDAVQRNNQGTLKNKNVLGLIKNLATMLLVASHLGNDGNSSQVSKVLEGCVEEVRSNLFNANVETFQKNVQIHLHHIRLGIGQSMLAAGNNSSNNITDVDR